MSKEQEQEQVPDAGYHVKELVASDDSILREEMPVFDFATETPESVHEITHALAQSVIHYNGLGLSAPQIGLFVNACAIKGKEIMVMFNPEIVEYGDEEEYGDEGCLSFPNLVINIKRPVSIRVRWFMPNGEGRTDTFTGLTSRVIQHEIDHLSGILFMDRATDYHYEKARKKRAKILRQQKRVRAVHQRA